MVWALTPTVQHRANFNYMKSKPQAVHQEEQHVPGLGGLRLQFGIFHAAE